MIDIDDGGTAFPGLIPGAMGTVIRSQEGMSLRDWFAGQALAGILADDSCTSPHLLSMHGKPGMTRSDVAAKVAYDLADAMLAARKVKS
jgi:hypothetical protein